MKAVFITNSKGAADDLCCICAEYGLDFSDSSKGGQYTITVNASSTEIACLKENEINKSKFTITQ